MPETLTRHRRTPTSWLCPTAARSAGKRDYALLHVLGDCGLRSADLMSTMFVNHNDD
jgi:hypothetical protein